MTFPADIVRVSYRGRLSTGANTNGAEIFNHGHYMGLHHDVGVGFDWATSLVGWANDLATKWTQNWGLLSNSLSAAVHYDEVRVYHLEENTGHTIHEARAAIPGNLVGGGANSLPYECALAVTFHATAAGEFTALPRRTTGRMYLPPLSSASVSADGCLNAGNQAAVMGWLAEWANDVQGMHVGPGDETNFAALELASRTDGERRQVRRVSVGRVIDSQRRRRNRMLENRIFENVET